jgi:tripartite ATP-independent transporter DctM subunit
MDFSVIIVIVLIFFLLLIGIPIWAALIFGSIPYFLVNHVPLTVVPTSMSTGTITSFILLAFPLFTLAGRLMNTGGITRRIFDFANTIVGWIPGGLGHVNVVASMIFAGMSGSAVADIGGLGVVEIKGMKEKGYDLDFSAAITIASSTIGPIIPPSTSFVLYAVIVGESIGKLFIGGILPGILMGISLMIMVYFYSLNKNYPVTSRPSLKEFMISFKGAALPMLNPVIILSGMIGGIFTPTEAAAVAVAYSFFLGKYVYKELTWENVFQEFKETAKFCSAVYVLVAAALIFSLLLTREHVGDLLIYYVKLWSLSPLSLLLLLTLLVFILGCFVEVTAMFFLVLPVVMPLIDAMGISKVYYGVLFSMTAIMGILTPPFGLGLFMICSMTGVPFDRVVRATVPFLVPLIIVLLLCVFFPDIITFLPNLLMK